MGGFLTFIRWQILMTHLADYARASFTALNHYGGQCKMGQNMGEGVVDGFLNVFGRKTQKSLIFPWPYFKPKSDDLGYL
ncbi:GMC oxidoreductase [Fictibacillus terranigra]|uniref:GMC oxidoreductase n=1 Tax=Fictibacillus terranigra TaxID=3058424 RepID=UPI00338D4838